MGYGWESRFGIVVSDAALQATIPTQTLADKGTLTCLGPITVLRLNALVTTAPTSTAAVIALDRRVTYASDTGRVEVGRITIPIGTAIGKVVWKELDPTDIDIGDQLVWELVTASTAGAAILSVEWVPRSEHPLNWADSVKSA
jgi:hypothetical protein